MKHLFEHLIVLVAATIGISIAITDFDFDAFKRCSREWFEEDCEASDTDSEYRELLDIAVECNDSQKALSLSSSCSRSTPGGVYCGEADTYYEFYVAQIFQSCSASIYEGSPNCSSECQLDLQAIRDDLGCCINTKYNYTGYPLNVVFTYSLWSSCGLEPVPSTCPDMLPYTLPGSAKETCSYSESISRILRALCSITIDELRDELSGEESCESFIQYYQELCSLDADGNLCVATPEVDTDYTRYIIPILMHCNSTQSCSSKCKRYLEDFKTNRGCCVNALYNSTFSIVTGQNFTTAPILADDSLFKLCDVATPPLTCEVVSPTDGSPSLQGFTFLLLVLLVMSLLLAN